jgi:hypothetical protein
MLLSNFLSIINIIELGKIEIFKSNRNIVTLIIFLLKGFQHLGNAFINYRIINIIQYNIDYMYIY